MDEAQARASRPATSIAERDLAEQLPQIAARMRRVAHHEPNWMRPPRNIYGWDENVRVDSPPNLIGMAEDDIQRMLPPDGPRYERQRRTCNGFVPLDLVLDDERPEHVVDFQTGVTHPATADDVWGSTPPWVPVADLSRYLIARYKLVENETRVIYAYTVDVPPDEPPLRHLSIQIVVPGRLARGDLATYQDELLQRHEPQVRVFFPAAVLGVPVRAGMRCGEAWEVKDFSLPPEHRVIGYRTPVYFDFAQYVDLTDTHPDAPRKASRILRPDGTPF